jgi:molybdopterin/thiamine biosynthesis adenylyltransferase
MRTSSNALKITMTATSVLLVAIPAAFCVLNAESHKWKSVDINTCQNVHVGDVTLGTALCCVKPAKTRCQDNAAYACSSGTLICNKGTVVNDSCGNGSCVTANESWSCAVTTVTLSENACTATGNIVTTGCPSVLPYGQESMCEYQVSSTTLSVNNACATGSNACGAGMQPKYACQ